MALASQLSELFEGLRELATQHLRLARLEVREDARFVGARLGAIAVLAPLILVGYALVCMGLALFLSRFWPTDVAFAFVGALNLVSGVIGAVLAARQLQRRKPMQGTHLEWEKTKEAIVHRKESAS